MNEKGSGCSVNGKKYELEVYNVVKNSKLNGTLFNTQNEDELGGCSSKNDIECNMSSTGDIGIELKKSKTPDWMQCSLKYDIASKKWIGSSKNKIPEASKKVFEYLISTNTLFNGNIPPFMLKNIKLSLKKLDVAGNDNLFFVYLLRLDGPVFTFNPISVSINALNSSDLSTIDFNCFKLFTGELNNNKNNNNNKRKKIMIIIIPVKRLQN